MIDGRERVCLITGATSGIGRAAARELASPGWLLIVLGRDGERCRETVAEIESAAPEGSRVEYRIADLSSLQDVLRLSEELHRDLERIDVLVNNAGAIFTTDRKSADDIEMTWALNHFGYFWLTVELLPLLEKADNARIVNVSSRAHVRGRIKDRQGIIEKRNDPFFTYSNTKLANIWFTRSLARRLADRGITVNSLHPGVVATRFGRGCGPGSLVLRAFATVFGVSSEKGAETVVYLARSPEVASVSGAYFVNCKQVEPSALARDDAMAEKLFDVSEELTGELKKKIRA
ncbi:MAG: SDR family oxidoreductase [Cyanobacteria bacterium HKST-UBA02]|nr:SDR family oxidoreductase [Cyanobacteria bacterium HKST-UBA02]